MALAIHFEGLIRQGVVRDYADLARLGGVTRARITQIMNLLNLAPEIQEVLLATSSADWLAQRQSIASRPAAGYSLIKFARAVQPQSAGGSAGVLDAGLIILPNVSVGFIEQLLVGVKLVSQ